MRSNGILTRLILSGAISERLQNQFRRGNHSDFERRGNHYQQEIEKCIVSAIAASVIASAIGDTFALAGSGSAVACQEKREENAFGF